MQFLQSRYSVHIKLRLVFLKIQFLFDQERFRM